MQDFIEEIIRDSMIAEDLISAREALNKGYYWKFMSSWGKASAEIERLILSLGESGMSDQAQRILTAWKNVREAGEDIRLAGSAIESELLPAIDEYLYAGAVIEVTEGRWTLKSSSRGFLTLKDEKSGTFIHDPYDPMNEARELAKEIFDPDKDEYHILGMGLGYLPYALYEMSEGTSHIYVYEEDPDIALYASEYGVADFVDRDILTVVTGTAEEVTEHFVKSVSASENRICYVQDWKHYAGCKYSDLIENISINDRTVRNLDTIWRINTRCNKKIESSPARYILSELKCDECVVVAAGPSLDDNMDFLKEFSEREECGYIIAVNTALRRLCKEGILVDFVAAIDPLMSLADHLDGIEDYTKGTPLITNIKASSAFWKKYKGPIYTFKSADEDGESGDVWNVGGTVASLALEVAFRTGAETIRLIGVDLAYPDGKNHAGGVSFKATENRYGMNEVKSNNGGYVPSSREFIYYRKCIEDQIAHHPGVKVINMSKNGAYIEGTVIEN